jgi:multiple sugar transport system substrate-binding protein
MKRVTKATLAMAGLAVAGLARQGCAGGTATNSGRSSSPGGAVDGAGKTITVTYGVNNLYPTEQKQWFSDMGAKFTAKTGATLQFETWATPNDELTKIQTSVLSGQGPDVYAIGTTFTPTAYATKA